MQVYQVGCTAIFFCWSESTECWLAEDTTEDTTLPAPLLGGWRRVKVHVEAVCDGRRHPDRPSVLFKYKQPQPPRCLVTLATIALNLAGKFTKVTYSCQARKESTHQVDTGHKNKQMDNITCPFATRVCGSSSSILVKCGGMLSMLSFCASTTGGVSHVRVCS